MNHESPPSPSVASLRSTPASRRRAGIHVRPRPGQTGRLFSALAASPCSIAGRMPGEVPATAEWPARLERTRSAGEPDKSRSSLRPGPHVMTIRDMLTVAACSKSASRGGKKEQGSTATLVFPAFLAMWFVQLTESKGRPRDRNPLTRQAASSLTQPVESRDKMLRRRMATHCRAPHMTRPAILASISQRLNKRSPTRAW